MLKTLAEKLDDKYQMTSSWEEERGMEVEEGSKREGEGGDWVTRSGSSEIRYSQVSISGSSSVV